jgi:hypothetical protein
MTNEPTTDKRRLCRPGDGSDNIGIDPEFERLIPALSSGERAALRRSLDAEGCRDALVAWAGHNILVDGHNRLHHCRDKGYPFCVIEKEFADREAVKAYIVKEHLGRRNFSREAESYHRGKCYLEAKRQGARTDLTSGQKGQKSAAERLGEEYKVGAMTIRRDAKFAGAVDCVLGNCGQDARDLILSRDTGLTRSAVLGLAECEPGEQRKFIEELRQRGKRPRRPRGKGETITLPRPPQALALALLKRLASGEIAEVFGVLAARQNQGDQQSERQPGERGPRCGTTAGEIAETVILDGGVGGAVSSPVPVGGE